MFQTSLSAHGSFTQNTFRWRIRPDARLLLLPLLASGRLERKLLFLRLDDVTFDVVLLERLNASKLAYELSSRRLHPFQLKASLERVRRGVVFFHESVSWLNARIERQGPIAGNKIAVVSCRQARQLSTRTLVASYLPKTTRRTCSSD